MLFSLKGPNQTLCYAYVCDLTFCVSLVERLGRLRVTVSEFEASQGGCFPTVALIPPPPPLRCPRATVHGFVLRQRQIC